MMSGRRCLTVIVDATAGASIIEVVAIAAVVHLRLRRERWPNSATIGINLRTIGRRGRHLRGHNWHWRPGRS